MSLNIKNHHLLVFSGGGNPFAISFSRGVSVSGSSRSAAGVYVIAAEQTIDVDGMPIVAPKGATALIGTASVSGANITVRLFDAVGVAADGDFFLAVINGK